MVNVTVDLGVNGFGPLPQVAADPARWAALQASLEAKVFLRSEGTLVSLGAPQQASAELTAQARLLVERFTRFYDALIRAYFEHPSFAEEFLVNPLMAPLIEMDRGVPFPTAASRFDCVLDDSGELHVIENNAVGVCLYHYRNLLYLVRGLWRHGFEDDAGRLDSLTRAMSDGFRRHYQALSPDPRPRPTLGVLHPAGWLRAGHVLFRAGFERMGWRSVFGSPEHLEIDARGVFLRGAPVDLLWCDFLFYIAYQKERYERTVFPTKLAGFDHTPDQVAELLANRTFLDHLRSRRVVAISPAVAYLGLPKPLLSWVHRDDVPLSVPHRDWLRARTARTYSSRERTRGVVTRDQVVDEKDRFLVKPALYGGSHGVVLGADVTRDAWAAEIDRMWDDLSWGLQEFVTPVRTAGGDWLSVGVANFGGELGGFFLRTGKDLTVNVRNAPFVPAVLDGA
jgi:hypothetical protein